MGRRTNHREGCCLDRATDRDAIVAPVALDGRDFRGDLDIHVDARGGWHYNHSPVERKAMVCLFASMLVRDGRGDYWLVTPTEVGRIQVDDAPLLAVELAASGEGAEQRLSFRTNVDQIVTVTPLTPLIIKPSPVDGLPAPYLTTTCGIEVKLTRAAYYDMIELGMTLKTKNGETFGVWSCGAFFPLGMLCDHDA